MKKAEEKFREALLEYLQEIGHLTSDEVMTHWMMIYTSTIISDASLSTVGYVSPDGTPFWAVGGMLNYVMVRHNRRIAEDDDLD